MLCALLNLPCTSTLCIMHYSFVFNLFVLSHAFHPPALISFPLYHPGHLSINQ
jgi:hypothetical protein